MTVNYPEAFHKSPAAGFDGVFEWDFLLPAFKDVNELIKPMDFDCVIERKHHFLVFETKNFDVPVPRGQLITLESVTRPKDFTVIVLRGKTAEQIYGWEVWRWGASQKVYKTWFDGNSEALMRYAERWINWANR